MNNDMKIKIREKNGVQIAESIEKKYEEKPIEYVDGKYKEKPKNKKGILAILSAGIAILAKFKIFAKIGFMLTNFKSLFIFFKLDHIVSISKSMLLIIWVHGRIYGWEFALGVLLLILMHQMGHYFAAKKVNLSVSSSIFIPFIGAYIYMQEQPQDAKTEAYIAIGGPILGSISSFMCLVFYYLTAEDIFLALAYSGFILNVVNLIPLRQLDGGRVITVISPTFWIVAIILMIFTISDFFNPIIIIFFIVGAVQLYKYYKNPDKKHFEIEKYTTILYAVTYFGLIILLILSIGYIYYRM